LSIWWLDAAWAAFFGTFYWSHRQVRAAGVRPETRVRRDRSSDNGMALQFVAVTIAGLWSGAFREQMVLPGICVAVASIWLVRSALRHLGRQWRLQAVITEDHDLITTGPYRVVRHPVYTAFFGMLVATILMRGHPVARLLAVVVFVAGTHIRIRAEERLLLAAFGDKFLAYSEATPWAYLPISYPRPAQTSPRQN